MNVNWLLSVQPKVLLESGLVPIAYQYLAMPLCGSITASQLADSCVVNNVDVISAPVPSRTCTILGGGVVSLVSIDTTYCPLEFVAVILTNPMLLIDFTVK